MQLGEISAWATLGFFACLLVVVIPSVRMFYRPKQKTGRTHAFLGGMYRSHNAVCVFEYLECYIRYFCLLLLGVADIVFPRLFPTWATQWPLVPIFVFDTALGMLGGCKTHGSHITKVCI